MTVPLNQAPNSPNVGNPVPQNIIQAMFPNWPMASNNRWREEDGGTLTIKPGDTSATMNVSCPYSELLTASLDIVGYPTYPNNGTVSTANRGISRVLPVTHPLATWLFATAVTNVRGQKKMGFAYGSTNPLTMFLYSTSAAGDGLTAIPIANFTPSYGGSAGMMGIQVGTLLTFASVGSPTNSETTGVTAVTANSFTVNLANAYGGGSAFGYIVTGLQTPYMNYDRALFTVLFQTLPFQVLPDILVNGTLTKYPIPGPPATILQTTVGEWQRYCEWEFLPNLEILQKRAGSWHFTQGQGLTGTWPPGPPFPQAVFVRSPKSTLVCHWRSVPHQVVYGVNPAAGLLGVFNTNWQALLGKINAAPWPAANNFQCYNPSEMLLTAIKISPKEGPVSPTTMGIPYLSTPRMWDVDFHWSVTSPPRNQAFAWNAAANPLQGGHNVFPNPKNDGLYYFATNTGLVTGNALYQAGDYSNLFLGVA